MEQKIIDLMLSLICSAMSGEPLTATESAELSSDSIRAAMALAHKHDLAQIVAWGVKNNGLGSLLDADGNAAIFKAVYRHQQIKYEYDRLCESLEKAGIQFLPLKGAVIRDRYPQSWMRTSCDIDILIHDSDIESVKQILIEQLKYRPEGTCSHDVAFFSPTGVHIEMHYDLIEEGLVNASDKILKSVWSFATVKAGYDHFYEMPDELFYFYHIAHMAKHLLNGGCGIKPFIDLWILDNVEGADYNARNDLLHRGELLKFAEAARCVSQVWFGAAERDELTDRMEHYVLQGGVYGSTDNRISAQSDKRGGRIKYALTLIFLPYDAIKYIYPILQKHRWLTPVMQVHRWCRILLRGRLGHAAHTLARTGGVSAERVGEVHRFLDDVGLL